MNRTVSKSDRRPKGACGAILLISIALIGTVAALMQFTTQPGLPTVLFATTTWIGIAGIVWATAHNHQHAVFGLANLVTLTRAAAAAMLAGLIPIAAELTSPDWLWAIALSSTVVLCMDGLDGYLARKSGLSSEFGARFDMETDALLALVITLFLWQSGKLGIWVLGLGLMRYGFVIAAIWLPQLRAQLLPSLRRKTICVIQVGALCLMLCPWLTSVHASVIGILAFSCLLYSFTVDVAWLFRQQRTDDHFSTIP